ncbi:hypothetical protein [Synechococcus sp. PCC 6312]|uniref:hypothetical protein n=1 Tax=Synechococcus sp. (strain ATCC 27167 / PCC 6312) TaxID=195253 RepID=UPI00029F35A3|nr:hypothetical protein [Synechococcus sp. PCC 6312]AFY62097.1 hypothetical protein Syn6312_3044 [Synechococcus sp. PCC 6312]
MAEVATLNPAVMQAVEQLGYRVTVGDVAAKAGLDLNTSQKGLLALASAVGGDLQVAESGDIAYVLPRDFRGILRSKYLRIQLQEAWAKVWAVLFYLIRMSFGIFLILSIVLIFVAIIVIVIAASSSRNDNNNRSGGFDFPRFIFFPDFWWFFGSDPYRPRRQSSRNQRQNPEEMNFLEGIYSFLFGDGNPNVNLESRRWQEVGQQIINQKGAVVAEQIAPYLDIPPGPLPSGENFMIPVLSRFNGVPQVTEQGEIIYHFPDLQATAKQQRQKPVSPYLEEITWKFTRASSGQVMLAIGLGCINLVGALVLWNLLGDGSVATQLGGIVAFVQSIFWVLVAYGLGFLGIPLGRYYWILVMNGRIKARNQIRENRAEILRTAAATLKDKITAAQAYAAETLITSTNLAYTTEKDLITQEAEQTDKIDTEWQRLLEDRS